MTFPFRGGSPFYSSFGVHPPITRTRPCSLCHFCLSVQRRALWCPVLWDWGGYMCVDGGGRYSGSGQILVWSQPFTNSSKTAWYERWLTAEMLNKLYWGFSLTMLAMNQYHARSLPVTLCVTFSLFSEKVLICLFV